MVPEEICTVDDSKGGTNKCLVGKNIASPLSIITKATKVTRRIRSRVLRQKMIEGTDFSTIPSVEEEYEQRCEVSEVEHLQPVSESESNNDAKRMEVEVEMEGPSYEKVAETEAEATDADADEDERCRGMENAEVVFAQFGQDPNNVLQLRQKDSIPYNKNPTDVIIKVEASSITMEDVMIRNGEWCDKIELPYTPGHYLVGMIVKCGEKVEKFQVGDRVGAILPKGGGNARYVSVMSKNLVPVPKVHDASQLVCLLSTYMIAYQILYTKSILEVTPISSDGLLPTIKGKTLLVTNATSPLGRALVDLAQLGGADIVYGTSDRSQKEIVIKAGGHWLPGNSDAWLPLIKGRCDFVIDCVCSDGYYSSSLALKDTGHLIIPGKFAAVMASKGDKLCTFGSSSFAKMQAEYFMTRTKFYDLFDSFEKDPAQYKDDFETVCTLFTLGRIVPKTGIKVALSEVVEAHRQLENSNAVRSATCLPYKSLSKEWVLSRETLTNRPNSFGHLFNT